jgi:arylsulfatase A-like enzyme
MMRKTIARGLVAIHSKTLLLLLAICGVSASSCLRENKNSPLNIIYIMSDDHAVQAISAYDSSYLRTPNIDRLASEGILFENSFVTNSICAPSRAVMLTGKYSHLNGQLDNIGTFDGAQQTFPKLLQEHGYTTALVGKWHLKSEPTGFDYWNILPGQGDYYNPDFIDNEKRVQKHGYVTDITMDIALDWLREQREEDMPFCLLIHQKAPHRNWMPSLQYLDAFDDTLFVPPATFFEDHTQRGLALQMQEQNIAADMRMGLDFKILTDKNGDSTEYVSKVLARMDPKQRTAWEAHYARKGEELYGGQLAGSQLDLWKYNRYIRDYLACIKSVDDGVGRLLDFLDNNGLAENTLVVYTSDQGFYLGEHGLFDKRFMYEESLRTPLLMRCPGYIKPGQVMSELVLNIDYAPTFLELAGMSVPGDIQGRSLVPLLTGAGGDWRDAIYYHYYEFPSTSMVNRHYGIRTHRYKLMHFYYVIDEWELYDLEEDPEERHNMYDDPANAALVQELKERLYALRTEYKDPVRNDQRFIDEALRMTHYQRHISGMELKNEQ